MVESVERRLEKPTRDAFGDLLTLASADTGMRIVLTCRDYSIDQVRASFLRPAGIRHSVVTVPPLEDAELAEVESAFPMLARPLKNPALRSILRNPYVLDKALEISWSADRPVPESEREFRALFWREIVRADQRVSAGMARRREQVFQDIAVRRARALSAYVLCHDFDPDAFAALKHDSLVSSPDENPLLAATAHDVLEDWAILHWIEQQNFTSEGSFRDLAAAIGPHPAVRRSYRKWLSELIDLDPASADRFFTAAVAETGISAQFRDDTLVALLRAPSSPDFLTRHEPQLLTRDSALLKRVVHLLRVACMTTPAWLAGDASRESTFDVPDGSAWETVLRLVHRNLNSFSAQERLLLLGLIEDAVQNVSRWAPDVAGAEYVAGIGHWLLERLDAYGTEKIRKRILKVIAKIPKADPVRFEVVLRGTSQGRERRDPIAKDFCEIIFSELGGLPAARDLHKVVLSVAFDYVVTTDDGLPRNHYVGFSTSIEKHFGINDARSHGYFPTSAFRGPWIDLLRYHPRPALDFFIRVFNHSADWYAQPRFNSPLEAARKIEITFADGTTREHWGNPRLWNLYRGFSVGPCVLQSLLMALEGWLLDIATDYPEQLDVLLVDILRRSESAMLAAVVASVAIAHPRRSGEAILVLLSAPDYITLDRGRLALEHPNLKIPGMYSRREAENRIYEEERTKANHLPHRGQSLEDAVMNLQHCCPAISGTDSAV